MGYWVVVSFVSTHVWGQNHKCLLRRFKEHTHSLDLFGWISTMAISQSVLLHWRSWKSSSFLIVNLRRAFIALLFLSSSCHGYVLVNRKNIDKTQDFIWRLSSAFCDKKKIYCCNGFTLTDFKELLLSMTRIVQCST